MLSKTLSLSLILSAALNAEHHLDPIKNFVSSLDQKQSSSAIHRFDHSERRIWHYTPIKRTGLRWDALTMEQQTAFKKSLKTFMTQKAIDKSFEIMQLEELVRILENRPVGDTRRDPNKYFINFYGKPGDDSWTFRYEGHHLSLTFTGIKDQIISATPFFWGTNPAIVLSGPQKGLEVMKDEQHLPRAFMNTLSSTQKAKAIVMKTSPREILSKAFTDIPKMDKRGLPYSEMTTEQQVKFVEIIDLYMNRYSQQITDTLVNAWKRNDWKDYIFAWGGGLEKGEGHYYRIIGPDLLIEYCNTQGGANHMHTSIRDLKNDFGDDALRKHLKDHH